MITAYGTVDNVVKLSAPGGELCQKPWDNEKLLADIRSAVAATRREENLQLKRTLSSATTLSTS